MMKLEAVIFDFDGVIADTMQDNFRAWEKAFAEHHTKIEAIDYFLLEGMGRYEIAEYFVQKNNLEKELIEILVQKKEAYYKLDNQFKIYSEIPQLLSLLNQNNLKIALVTGASKDRIENTLSNSIRPYFNCIVTVDDVTNCKPHPEPYLKAIEKLQCNPQNTLVIENAKLGIESAKAAGCNCFAIETTLGKNYLQAANQIFLNHEQLITYFKKQYDYSTN